MQGARCEEHPQAKPPPKAYRTKTYRSSLANQPAPAPVRVSPATCGSAAGHVRQRARRHMRQGTRRERTGHGRHPERSAPAGKPP